MGGARPRGALAAGRRARSAHAGSAWPHSPCERRSETGTLPLPSGPSSGSPLPSQSPARVLARSPSSSSRAYACLTARARLRVRRSASIAPSNRAFMRRRVARLAWRTWMTALREARADAARALKSMKFFLVSGSRRAFMVRTHAHIRAQMRARAPRCEHARTCAGLEASRGAPEEVPRLVRRAAACDAGTTQICAPRSLRQSIALTLSFRNGFCPLRSCSS